MSPGRTSGAVRLLEDLVRISSVGVGEGTVTRHCALLLTAVNAQTEFVNWAPNREQLIARFGDNGPPLTLTGHVDTVPADPMNWSVDPWAGASDGNRIIGRGTSDMKSGVAAMVTAVVGHLRRAHECRGVQVVLTAAEETGCQGAMAIRASALRGGGPLLVGEPTGNALVPAHKGALWLRLTAQGRAAHGSAPDLGDNAVVRLARAAIALHDASAWPADGRFGAVTANVGLLRGGLQPNVVPDSAEALLDLRTVPGVSPAQLRELVKATIGEGITVDDLVDLPLVDTDLDDPFVGLVREALVASGLPDEPASPARYFTDASALAGLLGDGRVGNSAVPTVILGPGEPDQCHVVDEWCRLDRVDEAVEVYSAILAAWCQGARA
ncbi:MAG: M20 family metallopeptidase [Actinomycetota bacterium]|nr:M20 family metallopeptidase [Actinomycetota bacterium]